MGEEKRVTTIWSNSSLRGSSLPLGRAGWSWYLGGQALNTAVLLVVSGHKAGAYKDATLKGKPAPDRGCRSVFNWYNHASMHSRIFGLLGLRLIS